MVIDAFRKRLLEDFSGLVLVSGDTVLVGFGSLKAAISLIGDLRLLIIGLEGFRTDGTTLIPMTHFIADLSGIDGTWCERVQLSLEAALKLAETWTGGPEFVEFTLATATE